MSATVLHLATYLQGGAGRSIVDLAVASVRRGRRTIVVATLTPEPGFENYPQYLKELEAAGVELVLADSLFKRDRWQNALAEDAAILALRGAVPVVIHAHAAIPAGIGLALRRRLRAHPPVIQTMHGWSRNKLAAHVLEDLAIMREVDLVVFPSDAARAQVAEAGGRFAETEIVPYGIATAPTACLMPEGLDTLPGRGGNGTAVLMTVGSLTAQKNHAVVVEALPHLVATHDVVAVLVGEGPETGRLASRAAELGVADRVQFTGYMEDASAALALADLLVQPSLTESFGIAVVEAFRARVPVVASDIPALAELVRPGVTGWRFDPTNPADLAATIAAALDTPARIRQDLLDRAERAFLRDFTIERMIDGYERLYSLPVVAG
ncbi:MAG: glycosyltransferase family 4 protein [Vicinamibacterales bacterium]